MPFKLSTLLSKVDNLSLEVNKDLINRFHEFMKNNSSSERHIINNLKVILNFDSFFQSSKIISEAKSDDINRFLDSKIKSQDIDPEKKWITTWNLYMNHLKFFFRWLYNSHLSTNDNIKNISG